MVVSPPGMHGFSGEEYFVRPIHYAWVVGETAPFPCHSFIVFKLFFLSLSSLSLSLSLSLTCSGLGYEQQCIIVKSAKAIMPPNAVNSFNSNLNSLSVIAFVFQGCWNSVVFVCLLFDHGRRVCFCGYGLLPFCDAKVGWVDVRMCRFSAVLLVRFFLFGVFFRYGDSVRAMGKNCYFWHGVRLSLSLKFSAVASQPGNKKRKSCCTR